MRKYVPSDFMVDVTSNDIDQPSNVYVKVEDLPRWISVSERLPDEHQEVLVWNGGGQCHNPWQGHVLCEYRNGEWRESQQSDLFPGITHWMPLPEPPEVR
jgi:hypothetical protein